MYKRYYLIINYNWKSVFLVLAIAVAGRQIDNSDNSVLVCFYSTGTTRVDSVGGC